MTIKGNKCNEYAITKHNGTRSMVIARINGVSPIQALRTLFDEAHIDIPQDVQHIETSAVARDMDNDVLYEARLLGHSRVVNGQQEAVA